MTRRAWTFWAIAGALLGALTAGVGTLDVARLTGVRGDEATYVAMALSLAKDRDLEYRAEDLARFRSLYGSGPEGIFLKRAYTLVWHLHLGWPPLTLTKTPVPTGDRLAFAKPFIYSLVAAPFAWLWGLPGLLELNILLFGLSLACAVTFGRARLGPWAGTLLGVAFLAVSAAPVYVVWLTPETFNLTLVFVAYFLWLYKKVAPPGAWPGWSRGWTTLVAALLLGIVTFSKISNGLLIGPILVDLLASRSWRRVVAAALLFVIGSIGLFAANEAITGDWNYQGGAASTQDMNGRRVPADRKSFYTHFPFDQAGTDFDDTTVGTEMVTNEVNDEHIFAPSFLFSHLRYNLPYFFVGRDSGLVPYFFPGALLALVWFWRARRAPLWQWTTSAVWMGSAIGLLVAGPGIWNGGGGPVGNRYFLSIYPTMLFLAPAGAGLWAAVVAAAVGATCVGPIVIHPFAASRQPWLDPARWPLRLLPVELTIMQQLPVSLNILRSHVEVSKDPEVLLYYMDQHTYYQEAHGFWVAPGTADIVVRTERPLTVLTLTLTSDVPNDVEVSIDGRSDEIILRPHEPSIVKLAPETGVFAYASYQIVLRIWTAHGFVPHEVDPASADTRMLGAFVSPTYAVAPEPARTN